tara:strand:+ start:54 stop:242 length:189 start_codon:yes stop_codon:yes gene_type:complete
MSKEELNMYIDQCRDILESKGETCPAYVGFEKETYTLTKEEMHKLAFSLYLVYYELNQNEDE